MEEEARQEELATIVGALSAIDLRLQEVEETVQERAGMFREEAEQSESHTSVQFNIGVHVLREIRSEVQELREYIGHVEEFMRTGTLVEARSSGILEQQGSAQSAWPEHTRRRALQDAASSFEKASDALYVAGRALEIEGLDVYADHLLNLSESVEAEAKQAQSALESKEEMSRGIAYGPS